jgi:hypothetical protein
MLVWRPTPPRWGSRCQNRPFVDGLREAGRRAWFSLCTGCVTRGRVDGSFRVAVCRRVSLATCGGVGGSPYLVTYSLNQSRRRSRVRVPSTRQIVR